MPAEPGLLDVAKEAAMEAAKVVKVSPNIMFICGVICLSFGGVLFIVSGALQRSGSACWGLQQHTQQAVHMAS